ncbi:hypothetical protein [Chelatococcus asaccharovorans]|uniref:Uncharacterized protein n=1 Tax=Chelatococcus asaccharovorans TaxID=28210 RepID=A0A2V3TZS6_9HYPH|nr:hypothetical protein [Chelatococcus asaccharovorans]MBS7704748.1 hypothetical protein [Chelatococcus asaccharovorans]PXW54647.1 hypothetical protein C7450_111179 [Chelatococcus asaccharovorans]
MKILDSLAALITVARDDKATSTIIAESLEKARAEYRAAATALATAEAGYTDALLDSPKAARAAHDARADARVELDRTTALVSRLEIRHGETIERESEQALTSEKEAVEAEAKAVARALREEYAPAANTIVALLARLQKAEAAVAAVNQKLADAGRWEAEKLEAVEHRRDALPLPHDFHGMTPRSRHSVLVSTLRRVEGVCDGWFAGNVIGRSMTAVELSSLDVPEYYRR